MANCCVWDFTLSCKEIELGELTQTVKRHGKKWSFQKEEGGDTGYEHYQGRISLKNKQRLGGVRKILPKAHWSPTSKANRDNNFYVTKDDTRIAGPWMDQLTIDENYVPRQIRQIKALRPWQQTVLDMSQVWNERFIDVLVDIKGNSGKSTLMGWMEIHTGAKLIPPVNNAKDLARMSYCIGVARTYMVDMPRAMNKEHLGSFYSSIEYLKNGRAYDDRYNFRHRFFDCPNIWIFTNKCPDVNMLSRDRWRLWKIEYDQLVRFDIADEFVLAEDPILEKII